MNRQVNPNGHAPRAQDIKGGLRHPDGSFDIAAYAKLAHRERAAAGAFRSTGGRTGRFAAGPRVEVVSGPTRTSRSPR